MKTKRIFLISLPLVFMLLLGLSFSAQASPAPQIGSFQTPTAGPDGRIIYTVGENDNCYRIELLLGVTIDQIIALNPQLDADCVVFPGQQLLVGVGGPAAAGTVTPGPSPTPTIAPPTATPFNGTTEICVLLFNDINGNALREENELGLADGAVSVTNRAGEYSETRQTLAALDPDTLAPQPVCFSDVPEGEYSISVAVPDGYNPTIEVSYALDVLAGDRAFVAFGAQSQVVTEVVDPNEGSSSGLLGVLGAILLAGGLGLGWYATQTNKRSRKLNSKNLYR